MDLTIDHKALKEAHETRRYFKKFEKLIGYLGEIAQLAAADQKSLQQDIPVLRLYLNRLSNTFTALSYKYLMAGRVSRQLPNLLNIDKQDSGFPVYQELLQMANDALQADAHLASLPQMDQLKQEMVHHILNEHTSPSKLQFAAAQRLYYQSLKARKLFWAQNDPQQIWRGNTEEDRRHYTIHWASYDSQQNIPVVYLLDLEDSGRYALPKDERRWPQVQSHLMAQAVAALKPVTIATGFDKDFDDLHPIRFRRFFIGPMYSHTFTQQNGPLREVLAEASGEPGLDWALAWTMETVQSSHAITESAGLFSKVERQVFQLDPFAGQPDEAPGYTNQVRSLVLPQRAHQILQDRNPPGLENIRKYVVGPDGSILTDR